MRLRVKEVFGSVVTISKFRSAKIARFCSTKFVCVVAVAFYHGIVVPEKEVRPGRSCPEPQYGASMATVCN